jgi:hypothetical protein
VLRLAGHLCVPTAISLSPDHRSSDSQLSTTRAKEASYPTRYSTHIRRCHTPDL